MVSEFDKKIQEWAKRAVEYCHGVATNSDESKKIDKAFYAFQSKPVENPEVLILGINPAGDSSYEGQYNNPTVWGIEVKENQGMTIKRFLEPNYYWEKHNSWAFWKGLERIFKHAEKEDFLQSEKFVYMNALYFNTNNINDFYKLSYSKEVFAECMDLTLELITKVIKLKRIVCLSIPSCFNQIPEIKDPEIIIDKLIVRGSYAGIPIYGIPHTSRPIKGGAFRVGKILSELFSCDQTSPITKEQLIENNEDLFNLDYQLDIDSLVLKKIVPEIIQQITSIDYKSKNEKEGTIDFILGNDIELRITATAKGYVAVRNTQNLANDRIITLLKNNGYDKAIGWLGLKPLKNYNSNDATEISETILAEIKAILEI